jgi:hypothetical protein
MKKMALIALILCMLSACQNKNVRTVTNLDAINTANPKSYKGGNIVDDRMVPKAENIKIKDYANPNIKIKIFWEN